MKHWAEVPNAVHMLRILKSVRANTHLWSELFGSQFGTNYVITRGASLLWRSARDSLGNDELFQGMIDDVMELVGHQSDAFYVVTEPLAALIAYDCAHMMDSDPNELKILAKFGDERAILMLPAAIVFSKEKNNGNR